MDPRVVFSLTSKNKARFVNFACFLEIILLSSALKFVEKNINLIFALYCGIRKKFQIKLQNYTAYENILKISCLVIQAQILTSTFMYFAHKLIIWCL